MEETRDNIIKKLKAKYPDAEISYETAGTSKIIINIVDSSFEGTPERERQDTVWEYLHEEFGYQELKHIGFILTWTPHEIEVYSMETA